MNSGPAGTAIQPSRAVALIEDPICNDESGRASREGAVSAGSAALARGASPPPTAATANEI